MKVNLHFKYEQVYHLDVTYMASISAVFLQLTHISLYLERVIAVYREMFVYVHWLTWDFSTFEATIWFNLEVIT